MPLRSIFPLAFAIRPVHQPLPLLPDCMIPLCSLLKSDSLLKQTNTVVGLEIATQNHSRHLQKDFEWDCQATVYWRHVVAHDAERGKRYTPLENNLVTLNLSFDFGYLRCTP